MDLNHVELDGYIFHFETKFYHIAPVTDFNAIVCYRYRTISFALHLQGGIQLHSTICGYRW